MDKRELIALSQSQIFKDVDIVELNRLLQHNQPSIKRYKKGETVWFQDEVLDRLIIVIDGSLKAQMTSPDGKTINMEEFNSFQPVAIPILFSNEQRLPVTLYSLTDSELFFLPKEMLLNCCMANKRILENVMGVMSGKVMFLSQKIKFLQLSTIKQKIKSILLRELKKSSSMSFKLKMTREEMAKEMGVTRPSLSREFANLVQKNIITQDRDEITVLNIDELKEYK